MNLNTSKPDTANPAASGYLTLAGRAERRWMGKTQTDFLATGGSTGGKFCLVDEIGFKGDTVPLHKHDADDESFYVLDGEISISIGGGPAIAAPKGSFAHVPGGTVHGFRVESARARYLILTTAQHGNFYRTISDASKADGSAPGTSVTGSRIEAACKKFGVDFVGPFPSAT